MREMFRFIAMHRIDLGKENDQKYRDAFVLSCSPDTVGRASQDLFKFSNRLNAFLEDFCKKHDMPLLTGAWIQWDDETAEKSSEAYTDGQIHIPSVPSDLYGWHFIIFSENTYRPMSDPEALNINGRVENQELKNILVEHLLINPTAMYWVSMIDYEVLERLKSNQSERRFYTQWRGSLHVSNIT